jgi:hypothetical protein
MSMPYCNNLRRLDEVEHAVTHQRGLVASNPRENAANVCVQFHHEPKTRYVHISELRLIENGHVAEDVPPCDGIPPESKHRPPSHLHPVLKPLAPASPLEQLLAKRRKLITRLADLDEEIFELAVSAVATEAS